MSIRCGLVVNPVAGIGGEAALAGSDGSDIQRLARARGAAPRSTARAVRALRAARALVPGIEIVTGAHELGADACAEAGARCTTVYRGRRPTDAGDTKALAALLAHADVDLLLFAGGDGTARDVCSAVGAEVLTIGIPAGVKMHSGVFAITPEHVGSIVQAVASGRAGGAPAEVVDIDEAERRRGRLGSRLYGQLLVPRVARAVQRGKAASIESAAEDVAGIATAVAGRLLKGVPCLLGPGTTVRDVVAEWGIRSSLLGVDVLEDGRLTGTDLTAPQLRELIDGRRFQLLVSPIGGQGILLGRGNQQLDAALLERLRLADLMIVSPALKLAQFAGRPLLVDAPTEALNEKIRGLRRVITGARDEAAVRVS